MILALPQTLPARQLTDDGKTAVAQCWAPSFSHKADRRRQPSGVLAALDSTSNSQKRNSIRGRAGDAAAAPAELDKEDGWPRPRGLIVRGRHPVLQGCKRCRYARIRSIHWR